VTLAALGPHGIAVNTTTTVEEAGKLVSELSDHAQIDNGDDGSYHAVYTNSADYGRETTFTSGKLYLRPRYQRWHARAPEAPDEPVALRDEYAGAVAAVWDLLAPGVEVADGGATEVSSRPGRKITLSRSADPDQPPAEPVSQRKWREGRTVDAVSGEVVLDNDKGVPLAVKLAGTIGFMRDGRRFTMKLSLDSTMSGLGSPAMVLAPAEGEVIATPERLREVDDRDYLLQGIAPPLRRNPDGTAVPPAPITKPGADKLPVTPPASTSGKPGPGDKPGRSTGKANRKPGPDDPPKRRARPDDGARP
jgi:hypothetical protein